MTLTLTLKIINAALILIALYMSLRAGWLMITGKPEMTDLFYKWNIPNTGVLAFGLISIIGALFLVHPKTYVLGNFIILAIILFLIVQHLHDRNIRGVLTELPFFALSLIIVWLPHPFDKA
jgi:hypothetical protein